MKPTLMNEPAGEGKTSSSIATAFASPAPTSFKRAYVYIYTPTCVICVSFVGGGPQGPVCPLQFSRASVRHAGAGERERGSPKEPSKKRMRGVANR